MVAYLMMKQSTLSELRARCDMTQQQFATLIGVSERMYRYYEHRQFMMPRVSMELLLFKLKELELIPANY
jgi:DNA-binding XRE family transcriptional regulator